MNRWFNDTDTPPTPTQTDTGIGTGERGNDDKVKRTKRI